jgi:hypothetical protein
MLNALLSLPKACSEFTRRGERRVAGEGFRSLDLTSKRHLKELRLDRKSVLPLLKKISDGRGQSLLQ